MTKSELFRLLAYSMLFLSSIQECVATATSVNAEIGCHEAAPGTPLRDPEFNSDDLLATWQVNPVLRKNGQLKRPGWLNITPIDPATGLFLMDQTIPFSEANPTRVNVTNNGPEWAYSQRGPEVYFTAYTSNLHGTQIGRISRNSVGEWQLGFLPGSKKLARPEPSKSKINPVPKVYYTKQTRRLPNFAFGVFGWREDAESYIDIPMSEDARTGRWLPDGQHLFYHKLVAQNPRRIAQLYLLNVNTSEETRITDDNLRYISIAAWNAPELDGATALLSTVSTADEDEVYIKVWRQDTNGKWIDWTEIHSFIPELPDLDSPEPFVYKGRSYLLITSRTALSQNLSTESVIWVATIDPSLPSDQKIGQQIISQEYIPDAISVKADPEVLITPNDGVWIYYLDKGVIDMPDSAIGLIVCNFSPSR